MKKCFFILLFFPLIYGHAQITGMVTDSKTKKPVTEVEVFIHGQTHYTFTNADGQFVLGAIHPGFADVVLYKKGYQLFKSSIRIQPGKAYVLNLTIDPSKKEKGPKIGKADDWERGPSKIWESSAWKGIRSQLLHRERRRFIVYQRRGRDTGEIFRTDSYQ